MKTSKQLDFKHPNFGRPIDEIVATACAYLPPGAADWENICRDQFTWLSDRVCEALDRDDMYIARWMSWRSWDPVHLALLAMETGVWDGIRDARDGFLAGWFSLLREIHQRRYAQYRAKVKLFLTGGAG